MEQATGTELKPGSKLLSYNVLGLLAQGGMAEVYLARKNGAQPVVIKRIRPGLVEDPQFVRMFLDDWRDVDDLVTTDDAEPEVVEKCEFHRGCSSWFGSSLVV